LADTLNDRAFVGTRRRSFSMTGSRAAVPDGAGHPGELGTAFPLAAYQSAGKPLEVPTSRPGWKAANPGWPGAAAAPVERIAKAFPAAGRFPVPKLVRIDRDCAPGAPVPSASRSCAPITPHLRSGSGGASVVVWQSSMARA